jgi:cholesterol oxidase
MGMDVATALYLLINRVDKKGEVTYDRQSGTETELE